MRGTVAKRLRKEAELYGSLKDPRKYEVAKNGKRSWVGTVYLMPNDPRTYYQMNKKIYLRQKGKK